MKNLEEEFNPEWDYVIEMASIGKPILNKIHYHIVLHGTYAGDREKPHIHIYLKEDKRPFSKFNFEIALDEILCCDEINLITMRDKSKHINIKNINKCSWDGYIYMRLKNDFENWLFSNPELREDFKDNLDAIIYFYNQESYSTNNSNPLLEYIKSKGMKIQNKFRKYFSEYDINKYTYVLTIENIKTIFKYKQ